MIQSDPEFADLINSTPVVSATFTLPPTFPFTITIPPDTRIQLYPDGTWSGGSADELEAALRKMTGLAGMEAMALWMLLRELRRSEPVGFTSANNRT